MLWWVCSGVRLPTGNRSIFSYFIDMETGNFVPWDVLVPSTKSLIEKGAVITIGETMGMGMGATQDYSQCLKAAAYGYDNYSPAASVYGGAAAATLQAQRSYPVMPQPGYTSVIVDPQQYHVANGYAVH